MKVYDTRAGRRLVAAVEIVSPANKDRPEHRRAFVAKCATMLRERVCVTIVDIVTTRSSNLYGDLIDFLSQSDPSLADDPPPLHTDETSWTLETWTHPLALGHPLPTLPLWLAEDFAVPLDLEVSYQKTCRILGRVLVRLHSLSCSAYPDPESQFLARIARYAAGGGPWTTSLNSAA